MKHETEVALRAMLGPEVGIGVTCPAEPPLGLWPVEAAAMTRAIPKRRAEFAAGRRAARIAFADLGLPPAAVAQGADRAPQWPAGLTGSIAHCETCCIAAVALIGTHGTLGIDVEPATGLDHDLIALVCNPAEREWTTGQPDPGLAAKMIFSAKEAVYKAQYPLTGTVIGFDRVTVAINGHGFEVNTDLDIPALTGKILVQGGLILTYAFI